MQSAVHTSGINTSECRYKAYLLHCERLAAALLPASCIGESHWETLEVS